MDMDSIPGTPKVDLSFRCADQYAQVKGASYGMVAAPCDQGVLFNVAGTPSQVVYMALLLRSYLSENDLLDVYETCVARGIGPKTTRSISTAEYVGRAEDEAIRLHKIVFDLP